MTQDRDCVCWWSSLRCLWCSRAFPDPSTFWRGLCRDLLRAHRDSGERLGNMPTQEGKEGSMSFKYVKYDNDKRFSHSWVDWWYYMFGSTLAEWLVLLHMCQTQGPKDKCSLHCHFICPIIKGLKTCV